MAGLPFKAFFKPAEIVLTRHEKGPIETKRREQAGKMNWIIFKGSDTED